MYQLWVAMVRSQCISVPLLIFVGDKLLSWGRDSCNLNEVLSASDSNETCRSESCMKNLVWELLAYYMDSTQHKNY